MKLASAIEEFIQYKKALGSLYTGPANVLKAFLRKTGNLELDALTTQHGEAFLPIKNGRVTSAWFHRYNVLGNFFRFATSRGYLQHRVLPTSMPDRPPRFVPYIYSTDDMRRLLGVPDSHYSPSCPLSPDTMRTLILVLYGTGLRLGEVTRLKHEDVDFRKAVLTIRETKFGKSRLVPIGKDLVSVLKLYRWRHRPGVGYQRPPTILAELHDRQIYQGVVDHCPSIGVVPLSIEARQVNLFGDDVGINAKLVVVNCPEQREETVVVRVRSGEKVADLSFTYKVVAVCQGLGTTVAAR